MFSKSLSKLSVGELTVVLVVVFIIAGLTASVTALINAWMWNWAISPTFDLPVLSFYQSLKIVVWFIAVNLPAGIIKMMAKS